MGNIITVASGKGGTGKTTSVAAVSSCLAALGFKTLCIDFDAGMKNLDLLLGMADFAVTDFTDVLYRRRSLMQACCECPRIPGLFFLPAPALINPWELDASALPKLFKAVRKKFDYCLIDAPSGIGAGFGLAHCDVDMSILVATGELTSLRDAQRAADTARDLGAKDVRLLVNRVKPKNFKIMRATIDDMVDTTSARLIGVVPEDRCVFRALHEGTPLILYKKRRSAHEFLDIARRIAGEDVPLQIRRRF